LPIKRGDRLVLTTKGGSEQVVALLDELDGSVMIRQRGGATSKRAVKDLRRDASAPVSPPAIPIPIAEDDRLLRTVSGICPVCREGNATARSAGSDSNPHSLRMRLVCPNGHEWETESQPSSDQF
jgi:hypothetical protein